MARRLFSLRTGILANLIFLILAAMLLINVIMIKLSENELINSRVRHGIALAHALALLIADQHYTHLREAPIAPDRWLTARIKEILKKGEFPEFIFVPSGLGPQWELGRWEAERQNAIALCRKSIITQKVTVAFHGTRWGVIWLGYENIKVSVPVISAGNTLGAVAISSRLAGLYAHLRKSEKIILIYIFLNTIILLVTGMYLLSRVVVRPIQKLLKVTEEFKEGEPLSIPAEPSGNEIGQLSHSLKMMLSRLEENKKELKAHIISLQQANEELRKTQEEVIRSEKLASVGRLAAGMAHEIGNPIGVVLGYLDLMKKGELSSLEIKDALERSESEIGRINKIIRQLLDYSRPCPPVSKHIRVHSLLLETIDMLKHQPIMRNITIERKLESLKDVVVGDEGRLKQVFVNILLNAADAIEEKQKREGARKDKKIRIETQNTRGTIKISFQDSGCGIPRESTDRIFDPFYSTKEPGKGTGLGLTVCYGIIEQMSGQIRAESNHGDGATIHVTLPLAEEGKETEATRKE